jgi:hypothetical protein
MYKYSIESRYYPTLFHLFREKFRYIHREVTQLELGLTTELEDKGKDMIRMRKSPSCKDPTGIYDNK